MEIIEYSAKRAEEIADLFYNAVHFIDSSIYCDEQKHAWAPSPIDYDKWKARLAHTKPFLLLIHDQVAGFIELEADGHIDCTYVSAKFQRKGVATKLLKHVIAVAKDQGLTHLYVEASIVAKPFFEKFGFVLEKENRVIRDSIMLVNYTMRMGL